MRRRLLFHSARPASQRFITIDEVVRTGKNENTIIVRGTSNSQQLTFSLGEGDIITSIPDTYIANSVVTNNGAEIKNNPGARKTYDWSIEIAIPQNNTITELSKTIIVIDEVGNTKTCEIIQEAGDAYLIFDKHSASFDSQSTTFTFNISSNAPWQLQ